MSPSIGKVPNQDAHNYPLRTINPLPPTDERYKSWIREVSSDDSLYYCNICEKSFSCSSQVSRHAESAYHKNKIQKKLSNNDDDDQLSIKKTYKEKFQQRWLDIEEFKCWLRENPYENHLYYCLICDKSFDAHLSHIYLHADSKMHLDKYKNRSIEINKSIDDSNRQTNEPLLSFDERKREAEIRFAALIADKNIPHHIAKDILSCFQHIGKDPKVLASMSMGRTKCKNIITNVLCPVETERVVDKIQNTKFSIFIDETSDICNDKWMTLFVRYVDSETLNTYSQLVKLIKIHAKDSSAEKLFHAFKCEMWKLQIPFNNIVALSCDQGMERKVSSFKTKLQSVCPRLITFPCPCHSASLAAHAATNRIPEFCEEFTRKIATYINSRPKRSAIFREFLECFQETNRKILKLCDTCYLCIMSKIETKAYFLFLKYALNYFNQFNAYFQASETRIHQLQTKSSNFLFDISKNFLKNTHLKPFFIDVVFSLKENQKNLNEINLGLDCEEYLDELIQQGHEDVITTVRENCLAFYVAAAEEIRKRLPITNIFLSKLNVFKPSVSLFENDRETSFNDVSFIVKTIGVAEGRKEEEGVMTGILKVGRNRLKMVGVCINMEMERKLERLAEWRERKRR
ncbi:hypothetical protein ALC57_15396 [Trachymyrmex cornetzi]|uniref:C2H2-type domain-containing protein n=1 Tax=Trachymyrmex cornetzi TaxID=471704 RepID=A0A151IX65_9HYME|nr:hypothetical protein ALC57_15396 [Trachymyrmex cornetzi]